jgi:ATP-dependent DNA helicase RecG
LIAVDSAPRPDDTLTRLKGIGPRSAEALAAEGIHSVLDLLLHLPRRYEDRTQVISLDTPLDAGAWVLLKGWVSRVRVRRIPRRRMHIVDCLIDDGRGNLEVVWFNQRWIHRRLENEPELYLFGQVREKRDGVLQLVNPEVEEVDDEVPRVVPVYRRLGRFGGRRLRRLVEQCLPAAAAGCDPLTEKTRQRFGLPRIDVTLRELHAPSFPDDAVGRRQMVEAFNRGETEFHKRLAFDELLAFACVMATRRVERRACEAPVVDSSVVGRKRVRCLVPFKLTGAQERVLSEISEDFASTKPMARLLQGDVGSGKTVVAALAMLMALDCGHQVAFMAPTEVLAGQHARTLAALFSPAGHTVHQLVGSLTAGEQREIRDRLADGSAGIVVGTHALFQESVSFANLGLVVVDEQHRFGVAQRQALAEKGRAPHLLVMTATPIPRSLALTVYGDLDLSIIDELPAGRLPVRTHLRFQDSRSKVLDFVRQEIDEGGRVFVIFPMIDVSEEIEAASLSEHEAEMRRAFPDVGMEVLHGRMGRALQEQAISRFRDGTAQVLLATTVVEVGVDVPEATVMIIESAQRFGLSQLHQLRGRVGRGARQSWCVLMADDTIGEEARRRLDVVCESNDGFEIAEADLSLRGPGELTGVRQWGPAGFRFASLFRDVGLIGATRELAAEFEQSEKLGRVLRDLAAFHRVEAGWFGD